MVDAVNRIGLENAPLACATVGLLNVTPNSRNTIPGEVFFTIDLRHPNDETLSKMDAAIRDVVKDVANKLSLETSFEEIWYSPPVAFDDGWGGGARMRRVGRTAPMPAYIDGQAETVVTSDPDDSRFSVGERIFHQKFGYGRIRAVEGNKLEVDFEKAGAKRVIDSFVERH